MEKSLLEELETLQQDHQIAEGHRYHAQKSGYWRALTLFLGFLGVLSVFWSMGIQDKLPLEFYLEFFGYPMYYWQIGAQLCFITFEVISLLIHKFSTADLKPWTYFSPLVEVGIISIGLIVMAQTLGPEQALAGPWVIYFVILIFSLGIYQDKKLSLLISIVMAISYLALAGILLQVGGKGLMAEPIHHLFRAGALVFCGIFAGILAKEVKKVTMYSMLPHMKRGQEALEGKELELEVQTRLARSQGRFSFPDGALDLMGRSSAADLRTGDHFRGHMTVVNADICAFSSLIQGQKPVEIFEFLSIFLETMEPEIREAGGMVTHHLGDGIVGLFNKNPEDGLKAAIEMQRAIDKLNDSREKKRELPITMGIGIQSGELLYGTVNLDGRMEGTLVGAPTHQAAKIQELTRKYGLSILITKEVLDSIPNHMKYHYRFVDRVKIKGAGERIDLYEIFDADTGDLFRQKNLTRTRIKEAGLLFWEKKYERAFEVYRELRTEAPGDPLVAYMEERCMRMFKR